MSISLRHDFDPSLRVGVGPAKRFGGFGIEMNVLHQLPRQIGDRGKDAAVDHIALDLREPDLNLIQP